MVFIPIVIPITKQQTAGVPVFIRSYQGTYINVAASTECDTYYSCGRYWVRFCINGWIKYYAESFETKEEAEKALHAILTYEKEES
jgi:hypothetical protein